MRTIIAAIAMTFIFAAATSAIAGSDDARIAAIEHKVSAMEGTRVSNNQQVASALARVQTIQDEFAGVKGGVEANRHLIDSQYNDILKRIADVDHRVQAIEDRLTIFSSQLSKALGKVAPAAAAEGDLYQKALDLAASARYLEAAAAFQSFVQKYPKSTFAPKAKFWVGECFYSMADYQRAIKEFQSFIEKYPRSPKGS